MSASTSDWRSFRPVHAEGDLHQLCKAKAALDVRVALSQDPARLETLSWALPGLKDASKQRWDSEVVDALLQLAEEAGVPQAIADQWCAINHTEGRAVMHMASADKLLTLTRSMGKMSCLGCLTCAAECWTSWTGFTMPTPEVG